MALQVDVRVGEVLRFSGTGDVALTLKSKSGRLSRLVIDADDTIDITLPQHQKSVVDAVRTGLSIDKKAG